MSEQKRCPENLNEAFYRLNELRLSIPTCFLEGGDISVRLKDQRFVYSDSPRILSPFSIGSITNETPESIHDGFYRNGEIGAIARGIDPLVHEYFSHRLDRAIVVGHLSGIVADEIRTEDEILRDEDYNGKFIRYGVVVALDEQNVFYIVGRGIKDVYLGMKRSSEMAEDNILANGS